MHLGVGGEDRRAAMGKEGSQEKRPSRQNGTKRENANQAFPVLLCLEWPLGITFTNWHHTDKRILDRLDSDLKGGGPPLPLFPEYHRRDPMKPSGLLQSKRWLGMGLCKRQNGALDQPLSSHGTVAMSFIFPLSLQLPIGTMG